MHGAVSVVVRALDHFACSGLDAETAGCARLPGQLARGEVQELLRQHDRRRIPVMRFMDHVQAHQVAKV